ncbi:MAG: diadenylate cyclase CdaA [Bacteroidales bacterium]|nr:diadenylate cyclase CdaA [Bacteroidales bacterium]
MISNSLLLIPGLPSIRFIDIVDIAMVAILFYELYKLVKGTNVMRIFWAVIIFYISWRIVDALNMRLSSEILGQFISIGLIALVIVFQPEIRKFLLLIGTKTQLDGDNVRKRIQFWKHHMNNAKTVSYDAYVQACIHMSQTRTGALIVFKRQNEIEEIARTGEAIHAKASSALIETIFFKNSPLHDGAMIVQGSSILAARCILPVSSNPNIDPNLGLRHRSAIGITEQLDVISVIVSEETGAISYAVGGDIHHNVTPIELQQYLEQNC